MLTGGGNHGNDNNGSNGSVDDSGTGLRSQRYTAPSASSSSSSSSSFLPSITTGGNPRPAGVQTTRPRPSGRDASKKNGALLMSQTEPANGPRAMGRRRQQQ